MFRYGASRALGVRPECAEGGRRSPVQRTEIPAERTPRRFRSPCGLFGLPFGSGFAADIASYRGTPQATIDLVAGTIDFGCNQIVNIAQHITSPASSRPLR